MSVQRTMAVIAKMLFLTSMAGAQGIDDVKQMIENERYGSAETLLEKHIGGSETEPEINYLLVKTYLEQKKTDEAARFINKHLQFALSDKGDPLNRIAAARYLLRTGNKNAADEIFGSIVNEHSGRKDLLLLLAMAEVVVEEDAGDAKSSLAWLEKAAKWDKRNPRIDILKGLAYRKLNDASGAYLSYQKAIDKDPGNVRAHYLMGKIFTAQKNPDVYLEHFRKAYAIDSTYAPVLEELYNHYYYRDIRKAKKYLEKYIANTDYSLQNEYYMIDLFYLNGEYGQAINAAVAILSRKTVTPQPRLYKLIAYSYAKSGDSARALTYINDYFDKEDLLKVIAPDYEFIAQLTEKAPGKEDVAIQYYSSAVDMDTSTANKAAYATAIAALYKKTGDKSRQAEWLGKRYAWKPSTNNIDLFNWGVAHYSAGEYRHSDSVFTIYTTRYPGDVYGYYWRAQANAAMDTSMLLGLAIPFYHKVVEIGEERVEKNRKMLLKAYGYLGGYEANITKEYERSLFWFEKYLAIDNANAEVLGYVEMLKKWMARKP